MNPFFGKRTLPQAWIPKLLLAVFGVLLFPPEFYHALEDHTDTDCHQHSGILFEKQHQHCAILGFECSAFVAENPPNKRFLPFVDPPPSSPLGQGIVATSPELPQLRAPPLV